MNASELHKIASNIGLYEFKQSCLTAARRGMFFTVAVNLSEKEIMYLRDEWFKVEKSANNSNFFTISW